MFDFRPSLKAFAGAALITLLAGCAAAPVSEPVPVTILHTNDHHGRFWRNEAGEYGMAARKTLIDSIRAEVAEKTVFCCYCQGAILIPVYRSQICNRLSLTLKA